MKNYLFTYLCTYLNQVPRPLLNMRNSWLSINLAISVRSTVGFCLITWEWCGRTDNTERPPNKQQPAGNTAIPGPITCRPNTSDELCAEPYHKNKLLRHSHYNVIYDSSNSTVITIIIIIIIYYALFYLKSSQHTFNNQLAYIIIKHKSKNKQTAKNKIHFYIEIQNHNA